MCSASIQCVGEQELRPLLILPEAVLVLCEGMCKSGAITVGFVLFVFLFCFLGVFFLGFCFFD